MTREEIEHLASFKPPAFMTEAEIWYNKGLLEGLRTADENPKLKWISVEDDLPYKHKELLGKDGDYTKEVLVAVIDIENNKILYTITIMADLGRRGHYHKWEWLFKSEVFKIIHWMPIPKLQEDKL